MAFRQPGISPDLFGPTPTLLESIACTGKAIAYGLMGSQSEVRCEGLVLHLLRASRVSPSEGRFCGSHGEGAGHEKVLKHADAPVPAGSDRHGPAGNLNVCCAWRHRMEQAEVPHRLPARQRLKEQHQLHPGLTPWSLVSRMPTVPRSRTER